MNFIYIVFWCCCYFGFYNIYILNQKITFTFHYSKVQVKNEKCLFSRVSDYTHTNKKTASDDTRHVKKSSLYFPALQDFNLNDPIDKSSFKELFPDVFAKIESEKKKHTANACFDCSNIINPSDRRRNQQRKYL